MQVISCHCCYFPLETFQLQIERNNFFFGFCVGAMYTEYDAQMKRKQQYISIPILFRF